MMTVKGRRPWAVYLVTMNLSHYQSLGPDVDRGDCQKRIKAGSNALPSHHQTTILLLEPGKGPLGLESRDDLLDRSAAIFLGLPDPLGKLCPDTPLPELLPQRFGVIAFIRRDDLQTFAGTAPFAGVDFDRIQQGHHLGTFIAIGRHGAVRQWHAVPLGEAVDEDPFALPAVGNALAAPLPRGKKRHRRRHSPNESSHVLRPCPASVLAWRPRCHPPASAAAIDASRSSTPIVA